MTEPEDVAAAIHGARITNMRTWIKPRLPLMSVSELYDAWIDAIEGAATFTGDPPWLDLVEAEYERRRIEPGAPVPRCREAAND
jgi:hypothetical protein